MTRTPPAWARDDEPTIMDDLAELHKTNDGLLAAERLHGRVVGRLPLDRDQAAREMTEEQRALRSSRPRNRRWRALDKHDREIDQLQQRLTEASARVHEAEQAVQGAPEHDARTLAEWIAAGERGERPAPTLYERERDRDAAKLLVVAVTVELDRALERRLHHVESNRGKMIGDARRDVDDARAKLLAQVRQLPALRQALLDCRETLTWIASYPDAAPSFGFPSSVALGLQEPVHRTLQTRAMLDYGNVLAALEEDAAALASAYSDETRRQLGDAVPRSPEREAMWAGDPDYVEWQKQQRERARQLADWTGDANRLGEEVREIRP